MGETWSFFFMGKGIHPNLDEATLISPNLDKFIKPQNVAKQSWDQEAVSLLSSWHPPRDRQKVKRDLKQKIYIKLIKKQQQQQQNIIGSAAPPKSKTVKCG